MVLDGHLGEDTAVRAKGVHVTICGKRKEARRGGPGFEIRMYAFALQTAHSAVAQLFRSDDHYDFVLPCRDCGSGIAEGIGSGGTIIFHAGNRAPAHFKRVRKRDGCLATAEPGRERTQPCCLHVVDTNAGVLAGAGTRFHHHFLQALIEVLAELGAAHADHGNLMG